MYQSVNKCMAHYTVSKYILINCIYSTKKLIANDLRKLFNTTTSFGGLNYNSVAE